MSDDEMHVEWVDQQMKEVERNVFDLATGMLKKGDDRVTILGMIQSAVMHALHDAGFTDETV